MRNIYSLLIHIYFIGIRIAALLGHNKALKWLDGRKSWQESLEQLELSKKKVVWFHVASLGEFEQARPLIEKYKASQSTTFILLTFFSPSGYELRKDYPKADLISYLPLDTKKNAIKFIELVQPELVVFVKYEFWFNFLDVLIDKKIPAIMISGIFRKNQHFFKWYGKWFKKHLNAFNYFFLQDENSKKLLDSIGINNSSVVGDNRFDRVNEVSQTPYENLSIESFCTAHPIVVFGSSWKKEEEFALQFSKDFNNWKLILAPHEINPEKINLLSDKFKSDTILWSHVKDNEDLSAYRILIIDQIGMLSNLYRYGSIAFIGGGFGRGIHNLLEAVVYGIPVCFGPNFQKFNEANELIREKAGFSVRSYDEFKDTVKLLMEEAVMKETQQRAMNYVQSNLGATDKIYEQLGSD